MKFSPIRGAKKHNNIKCMLLFTCICFLNVNVGTTTEIAVSLPEDLHTWCPYTTFCEEQPSQNVSDVVSDPESIFCCESCSCLEDCGLYRNCCTNQIDHFKIDETLKTVCRQLINKGDGGEDMNEDFFHIVDKCPDISESCNDRPTAPWGSYHPVYSPTTRMIYYNIWCAKCHNQTDILTFETSVHSRSDVVSSFQFLSDMLVDDTIGSVGFLRFVAPAEADLHSLICYPFITRECNPRAYEYQRFNKLCQSFNATYHDGMRTYGNVYCYICSHNDMPSEEILGKVRRRNHCDSTLSQVYQPRMNTPFTFLLNSKITQLVGTAKEPEVDEKSVWCKDNQLLARTTCRKIYCPEGQYRLNDGCTFLGDTYFVRSTSVSIVLTPRVRIHVNDLKYFKSDGKKNLPRQMLIRPKWFSDWELQLLLKVTENSKSYVDHFVANLYSQSAHAFNLERLLYHVNQSLQSPWSIVVLNTRYKLRAKLDENLKYVVHFNDGFYIPFWLYLHNDMARGFPFRFNDSSYVLREIKRTTRNQHPGNLVVSRMFFCEQVELLPHEYIHDGHGGRNIYLKRRNKYMGHGSFIRVQLGNQTSYRVCLSDIRDESSNGSKHVYGFSASLLAVMSLFLTKY